ncbi:L-threonylcarbamoyladenylate synthase [uncultured Jatrophihabitans sp.]|uniref:L-threonylcarbamoyladenylate synthase n=1 Tax=uncultured Jatrophihabitans sp. TaxID=1610747 RepID=UPI0035C9CA48
MARYFDVHPQDPQPRLIDQVVALLRDDALIAYPTDSCYALGFEMGSRTGADRIRRLRQLDEHHHFTLVCSDFAQLGEFVQLSNAAFRSIKAVTPGPYTFILPATREVPKRLAHPRKRTVGVRLPQHAVVQALVRRLGKPLVSSTLLIPGEDEPMTDGWTIKDRFDSEIDAVLDSGGCGIEPTTVVDLSGGVPDLVRIGAGDPAPFE